MEQTKRGIHAAAEPSRERPALPALVSGLPVLCLLSAGLGWILCAWFPSVGMPWWLTAGLLLTLSAAVGGLLLTPAENWVVPGTLLLTAALCILAGDPVMGGLQGLGNDLLNRLTMVTGRIYLDFPAEDSALWALLPVLVLTALVLGTAVMKGSTMPLLLPVVPVYTGVVSGLYPMDAGAVLLGLGSVLLLMRGNRRSAWTGKPVYLVLVLVCALAATCAGLALGEAEPGNPREKVGQLWHSLRTHSDAHSMPEGNLKNLRGWKKSEEPALELTMSQPQKLYLRGSVYEVYTGTAWEETPSEVLAEQEALFYWLHEAGFYGQSQIGTASALTEEITPQTLTVRNLGACGANGYYPYALLGSETLEKDIIGDARFPEAEQLSYLAGSVPQWYLVQQNLSENQRNGNVGAYLAAEEAYEAYVTEADMQLTNESWSVLKRQLGEEVSAGTLPQIRKFIRAYLEENLIYDEKTKTLNGSGDFLQYTLEKSGSGYSVHYATAATLMLRFFGVPARYVEGYFLSAAEAEAYKPGDTIILTQEHAHAWAEYYLPGVGFVPFEVTPGYIDDEELELGGVLAESDHTYSGNHLKYARVEQPERIEEPEQDRFTFSFKPVYLLWLALLALLVLAILVLLRRRKLKAALLEIRQAANREAIAMGYGYARKLLSTCAGFVPEGAGEAAELNWEALFSNHDMTAEQRGRMEEFSTRVLTGCRQNWSLRQKLRYRLWDCLY